MRIGKRRRRHGQASPQIIESLELRQLLTVLAWDDASQLTISFAPDGTDVGGQPSELFAEFAALGSTEVWQNTLVSAFDLWLSELGTTAVVAEDTGLPLGTIGDEIGDSRFGDVRIAATSMDPSVAAFAVPYNETISGTWAGDVLFNTEYDWQSLDEVFSVALHEFGHVLGLDHSENPDSVMFAHTGNQVMSPTVDDVSALQRKFGIGQTGAVEKESGDSLKSQKLQDISSSDIAINERLRGSGSLTQDDVDVFEVRSPKGVRGATIELRYDGGPTPVVTLQSRGGDRIDAEVVVEQNGRLVLYSKEVEGGKKYQVQIEDVSGTETPVSYQVTVSFTASPARASRIAKGQVNRESPQMVQQLDILIPQLFTFSLDLTESKNRTDAAVLVSIYNTDGELLHQLGVVSGRIVSSETILLNVGTYILSIEAIAAEGTKIPEMEFVLSGTSSSIPIGPGLSNPTYTSEYYNLMNAVSGSPYVSQPIDSTNTDYVVNYSPLPPTISPWYTLYYGYYLGLTAQYYP